MNKLKYTLVRYTSSAYPPKGIKINGEYSVDELINVYGFKMKDIQSMFKPIDNDWEEKPRINKTTKRARRKNMMGS